jgi:hypothetical protein
MTHPDAQLQGGHMQRPTGLAPIDAGMRQRRQPRRAGLAATLALCAGLIVAALPLPALSANGAALADLARSIHRMQAACERRAQARCDMLAADIAMAADASPRRASERDALRRRASAVDPDDALGATAARSGPAVRTD